MSPEECWAMLESSVNGTFVTLRKNGRPIALPVWFVVLDHKIYISTRGRKLERIRRDKRCSFLVEAGERWAELHAVHVECDGHVIEPSAELAKRINAAMAEKYAAYRTAGSAMPSATRDHYAKASGGIIELEPVGKLLNWDNRRLGVS
jgi:hypothetical protein